MADIQNSEADDRLSSLPYSILNEILSFLTTKESAKTCILSKHYQSTWAFVPSLNFVLNSANDVDLIDLVLGKYKALKLTRFHISSDESLGDDRVSHWVDYAVAHSVQELNINLKGETNLKIVDNLSSCQSLETLTLKAALLQPFQFLNTQSSYFTNLRSLDITLWHVIDGDSIGELISRCCKLEALTLGGMSFEVLDISAPSLRKLELLIFHCIHLQVSCERLEYFMLKVEENVQNFCGDMPSLQIADIELRFSKPKSYLFWHQIMRNVNHAAMLHFSYIDYKICPGNQLDELYNQLPIFCNLRILHLRACFHNGNIEFIVRLLLATPNLVYLTIGSELECKCNDKNKQWRARELPLKVQLNLKSLKLINDTGLEIQNMNEFINFLATNVSEWEELIKIM